MEGTELIAFQIISNVGMAKTKFIEALAQAKKGDYPGAASLMEEGSDFLVEGHKVHGELIKNEAVGNKTEFSILLMHAEDQFMSAETIKLLIAEMIEWRKELTLTK